MIKSKVLVGVSIAVALGATATGGSLLMKPTIANQTVYTGANNRKVTTKNNQEVNVTMYVLGAKQLKRYESGAYYKLNGQRVSFKSYSEGNPLGQATIKNYKGNNTSINLSAFQNSDNINNKENRILLPEEFVDNLDKVQVKLPVGTKLNVLWTIGNTVVVEYNGNLAMMSKNYLNTTGIPLTSSEVINAFGQKGNEKYIGTAITQEDPTGAYPAITFNPEINVVLLNGICYTYPLKPGTKVNVISESKSTQEVNTPIVNSNGNITGYVVKSFPDYEKVEYNGIIGYMRPETLTAVNYN